MIPTNKIYDGLLKVCLVLSCLFIAAFIYIALNSMAYPFHIEWMEGQSIDVVQRVREGLPLYTAPSIDYVPFIYTPYYYYVVAFVSLFTGVDFLPARLVSTLAALGCGGILYAWIRRESGTWIHGLIAAGLFFATYRLSGRWFDVARIDSLALLLTLSGLYAFFHWRGTWNAVTAAILFTAAFFTKQSTILYIAPVLTAWFFLDRRHALITGGTLAALLLIGILYANMVSNGWFWFYAFKVPAGHSNDPQFLFTFWKALFVQTGIILALGALTPISLCNQNKRRGLGYIALAAGLIVGSYVMRLHSYSYLNVMMPAHALLALFAGLSLKIIEIYKIQLISLIIPLLLTVQLVKLAYDPRKAIPTQKEAEAGNAFLAAIAKIDGDVFMPELQWVQTRVGKKSYGFGMAAFDIFRSDLKEKNYLKKQLRSELSEAIRSQQFAAVIPGSLFHLREKKELYVYDQTIDYPGKLVTGAINFIVANIYIRAPNERKPNE
jgi:hypothetical protein